MYFLNLEPKDYSDNAIAIYRSLGKYVALDGGQDPASYQEREQVTVLIVRLNYLLDIELLSAFRKLKYIITPTTGLDHIDKDYCESQSIQVVSLRGHSEFLKRITSTPELAWGLLLAVIRNIPSSYESVLNGAWNRDLFKGYQLSGKKIGIIGLGRTGLQMAEYAKAFQMEVVYHDPYVANETCKRLDSIEALLKESDVVSIHVHLNEETRNLLNQGNLRYLKQNSILVNTSRGGLVSEDALVEKLNEGILLGIGTDVLATELTDFTESPIYREAKNGANVVITPHLGGATYDAMHICEEFIAGKFAEAQV